MSRGYVCGTQIRSTLGGSIGQALWNASASIDPCHLQSRMVLIGSFILVATACSVGDVRSMSKSPDYNQRLYEVVLELMELAEHCQSCEERQNLTALSVTSADDLPEHCCARPIVKAMFNEYGAHWVKHPATIHRTCPSNDPEATPPHGGKPGSAGRS